MSDAAGHKGRRDTRLHPLRMAVLTFLGLILSGLAGAAVYFYPVVAAGMGQTGQKVAGSSTVNAQPTPGQTRIPNPGTAFTVLLLGSDDDSKFPVDHVLTQSMILVRIDPVAKHVTMLSIPRDLWVPLSTGGTDKIDKAYSYGGPAAAIATVERNFHVQIDEYVWIGLKGLIKLIDLLGGVDVNVTNPILDDVYPDDINATYKWAYTRIALLPGPQHLDGAHALQYVRSRHNDLIGDFGRSARQQQVLVAMKAKASRLNAADLPDLVNALQGEFKTSMGLARVRSLLGVANFFNPANITQIVLSVPTYASYANGAPYRGQSVVLPDWPPILAVTRANFP
jgi:LCP family protein required for cell wall assembly